MTLEERVQRLEDIEAIKYLQGKYQRALDNREFDEIRECFDIEVSTEYCDGYMVYDGRDEAVEFLESCMPCEPNYITNHCVHTPEIDIIDATHASGKWYLQDSLISLLGNWNERGAAIYDNQYIKRDDGKWYIKKIGYTRIFEERVNRNEYNSGQVGNVRFLDAKKAEKEKAEKEKGE
jgi:hypothetical protein